LRLRVDSQVLARLEQVRDDQARLHRGGLDDIAHDDQDLPLAGPADEIDCLLLGDQLDVPGHVRDQPVRYTAERPGNGSTPARSSSQRIRDGPHPG
jgi:hypothetical protein